MENPTKSVRETNLVLQHIEEAPVKSKTVMSWSSRKKKRGIFVYCLFCPKEVFLTFVFYLNAQCIEHNFRLYIPLHIKKHCFMHFFAYFKNRRKPAVYP